MSKISAPKYTRDFYPEDMQFRNWIEGEWRAASLAAGFSEWDGPILETLELYRRKSGDEIVGQLFSLKTKGGDELAIRPEMTPSLARMIAAKQASLSRPIKWFCISRMCRYERGQRGRLREFWQWNADVLGVTDPIADAEIVSVAVDGLVRLGLHADAIQVRINSRTLMAEVLNMLAIAPDLHGAVYAAADKRGKASDADVEAMYRELGLEKAALEGIERLMACQSLEEVEAMIDRERHPAAGAAVDQLRRMFDYLDAFGKRDFCRFDVGIVRGLAYYTGPVFEIYDTGSKLRAICGGGRYDRLLETMGGQPMPACGFGMGDVVLGELLRELSLAPHRESPLDDYVVPLEEERLGDVARVVGIRRAAGRRVDYAMKPGPLGKAFKKAAEIGAHFVILVGGEEWRRGKIRIKNLVTGLENEVDSP